MMKIISRTLFSLIFGILLLNCDKEDLVPTDSAKIRLEAFTFRVGDDSFNKYEFRYEGDKIREIEYFEDHLFQGVWNQLSHYAAFAWAGDTLQKIVINWYPDHDTLELDYSVADEISVTVKYNDLSGRYPDKVYRQNWYFDDHRVQRIWANSGNIVEFPPEVIFDMTWENNEIADMRNGNWGWSANPSQIKTPFLNLLPLELRQIFTFHFFDYYRRDYTFNRQGYPDYSGNPMHDHLIWSNEFIPGQVYFQDFLQNSEPKELDWGEAYRYETDENGFLNHASIHSSTYKFYYQEL